MIQYCKNCGSLLDQDATVCTFCGTAYAPEPPAVEPDTPTEVTSPVEKTSPTPLTARQKKTLIIAGITLLSAIILALTVYFLPFGTRHAVAKFQAVANGDLLQVESLAPAEYWDTQAAQQDCSRQEYLADYRAKIEERQQSLRETYESNYGEDYTETFTVLDVQDFSDRYLEDIESALLKQYNIDPMRVTAVHYVILRLEQGGSKLTFTDTHIVKAVQIDLQWYLFAYNYNPSTGESSDVIFVTSGKFYDLY